MDHLSPTLTDQSPEDWTESVVSSRTVGLHEPSESGLWVHWSEPWANPGQSSEAGELVLTSDNCIDSTPLDHATDAWRRVASIVDAGDACWRRCPAARGRTDCDMLIELIRAYGRDPSILSDTETAKRALCEVVCRTGTSSLQWYAEQQSPPSALRK